MNQATKLAMLAVALLVAWSSGGGSHPDAAPVVVDRYAACQDARCEDIVLTPASPYPPTARYWASATLFSATGSIR